MQKKDIIIGVHGAHLEEGGRFNILNSCTKSLVKAFHNNGVKAYSVKECVENKLQMNLTMGLNVSGYDSWEAILSNNIPNIMWNVDSIFYQNMQAIEKFGENPNFALLSVTPCDQDAIAKYFPSLQFAYLPGAVDLDLWKPQDCEKEFDIVYFSSMFNYEQKLLELQQKVQPELFNIMLDIYEIAFTYPTLSFWQVTQMVSKDRGVEFDKNQYNFIFHNLIYIIDYARRTLLVQSLSQFNVKLFGGPAWTKYISGNIEYMGEVDYYQSVDVMNKAKIVLHSQPMQLCVGINERVINASALETFTMASNLKSLEMSFGDNIGYYNATTYEDIAEKINYFLTNDEERISKAKNARKIVEQNHTITHRAGAILDMLVLK